MNVLETAISSFVDRKLAQPASRAMNAMSPETQSLAKGLLAGLAAGIVATAAKTIIEKIYPPRMPGEPDPPAVLAEKVAGHQLAPAPKAVATETIHWVFGAAAGAAYGAIAEFYPAATSRDGVSFGMVLMAVTHEATLPALGLSPSPANQSAREKSSELASHVVYGVVAETVRRAVRKSL